MDAATETKRLNVVVSADLHRYLKIETAKSGCTIAQFVSEAIKEKLDNNEDK